MSMLLQSKDPWLLAKQFLRWTSQLFFQNNKDKVENLKCSDWLLACCNIPIIWKSVSVTAMLEGIKTPFLMQKIESEVLSHKTKVLKTNSWMTFTETMEFISK